jgi:hypothetical protein
MRLMALLATVPSMLYRGLRLDLEHAGTSRTVSSLAARGGAVSLLLRLAAAVCFAWAVLLLAFKDYTLGPAPVLAMSRSLANGLGIANIALAIAFLYGARDPAQHRGAVFAAIALMALRMANAVYELLALIPAEHAWMSLGDLVLSTALLVGLLEALPRTFPRTEQR